MNLLFDLDGTLADPLRAFRSSMDFALDELRAPRLGDDVLRSMIGPPMHIVLPVALGALRDRADDVMDAYREHHERHGIYLYDFYPGMDDAMQALAGRHRLFVATSKPRFFAEAIFRHFAKDQYFEFIYGSELSGERSNKAELIAHIARERGLRPGETLMIGDRKFDVEGASANGIPAIGVTWGYGAEAELVAAGARATVDRWSELLCEIARASP
jgi:phosphoglycolate phosphatase